MNLRLTRRGRLAGAKRGSRVSQIVLNPLCGWVRAAEHPPRNPFYVLERRHGLAEIVERGGGVLKAPPATFADESYDLPKYTSD